MIVVPLIIMVSSITALVLKNDKIGVRVMIFNVILALVWLLWLGYLSVVPTEAYNNLCSPDQQVNGYCK